jgi:alpha/beta superfamily hydrolase
MNQINITFTSNGFLLKGILHLPKTILPPVVIGSHGLLSNSFSPKQIALARECNAHGIAYFRFDHRGCGESDGVFSEITSLNGRRNDLISAVNTIQMREDIGKKLGLFGSSMGGTVCISVADVLDIDAWVTYASPVRSSSVTTALKKSDDAEKIKPLVDQKDLTWDISDQLKHLHHIFILHIQKDGDHRMSKKKTSERFFATSGELVQGLF